MLAPRAAALTLLLIAAQPVAACTFCDGGFRGRQTLRVHHAGAKVVIAGQLKNPQPNATGGGTTDFHITTVLKDDPARGGRMMLTLPKYLPVIGDTRPDYLLYCTVVNGGIEPIYGLPASAAVVEYAKTAAAATDPDPVKQLGFFFRHLDHAEPAVTADAFLEFATAPDADILRAAATYDRARLRTLIAAPATPTERLGVLSFLLGSCGTADDAEFLAAMLTPNPPSERASAAFGGLLAGYILLKPQDGWAFAAAVLADERRGFSARLSAVNTVRFFQATRAAESKPHVLRCCAALLPCGDLADQAVEDLRRWGYWDLTADVLAQFPKPTHSAPIVRRAIVRYALTCPADESRRFVAALRQTDPRLVADVEEMLRRFDRVPVPKN